MPGPVPKPLRLKQLEGNPGKRRLNKNEPQFSGLPTCPDWLTPLAKIEWDSVVAEMASLDMLRKVDSASLAAYCQSYARWRSAELIVEQEGQTIQEPMTNRAGEVVGYKVKRHPATAISKDALASMHKASALFGFDPSSRSRLSVGDQMPVDPFTAFMEEIGADEETHAPEDIPNNLGPR
jgi:P27 family predicted phage terminase small subunit